jgi:hypothetical protein
MRRVDRSVLKEALEVSAAGGQHDSMSFELLAFAE